MNILSIVDLFERNSISYGVFVTAIGLTLGGISTPLHTNSTHNNTMKQNT